MRYVVAMNGYGSMGEAEIADRRVDQRADGLGSWDRGSVRLGNVGIAQRPQAAGQRGKGGCLRGCSRYEVEGGWVANALWSTRCVMSVASDAVSLKRRVLAVGPGDSSKGQARLSVKRSLEHVWGCSRVLYVRSAPAVRSGYWQGPRPSLWLSGTSKIPVNGRGFPLCGAVGDLVAVSKCSKAQDLRVCALCKRGALHYCPAARALGVFGCFS